MCLTSTFNYYGTLIGRIRLGVSTAASCLSMRLPDKSGCGRTTMLRMLISIRVAKRIVRCGRWMFDWLLIDGRRRVLVRPTLVNQRVWIKPLAKLILLIIAFARAERSASGYRKIDNTLICAGIIVLKRSWPTSSRKLRWTSHNIE